MSYRFKKITIKKTSLYYIVLVLVAIIFPLTTYPRIYGVDAFQVMWMANALREGVLFSNNTWLISPFSYFGYYPFSHQAIGVPIFLAFLTSLLNFSSFGIFGIAETILAFNIILIIIIYKSSRNLGNRLFKEEWSRFVFVAAILLSPNIIYDTTMTLSTRIIITIIMIVLLNLNLKILSNDYNNKFKAIIFLFLLLLVGALAHRLWMGTVITIIFMIFTLFIRKYKKLQHITVYLILPLSIIAFFYGLEFFGLDPRNGLGAIATYFDISIFFYMYSGFWVGLISLFFPIGVIITLYKLTFTFKNTNAFKTSKKKNTQLINFHHEFIDNIYYLLLFLIPLLFMFSTSFYAIIIFLPIIIIFSVQSLIYIKKFIINIFKKFDWVFPMVFLFFSVGYSFLYVQMILSINLWYMFVLFSIALFIYLVSYIIHKYNRKIKSKISFININNYKFRQGLEVLVLIFSIVIFSTTTVVGRWRTVDSSPYPWENRYLTEEEQEIIEYFQNEDIFGLIFTNIPEIANRISGVGFLPVFSDRSLIGTALYYGFISSNEVHKLTEFSLSGLSTFRFFTFNESYPTDPIRSFRNIIIRFNVSLEADLNVLRFEYNVQYIITGNENVLSTGANWNLIQSLQQSELFEPVFSTQHLLIWKIY